VAHWFGVALLLVDPVAVWFGSKLRGGYRAMTESG